MSMMNILPLFLLLSAGGAGANGATGSETPKMEAATFAGGCFWCMQPPFERTEGVTEVVAGYTGGHVKNPTYQDVCTGLTGHLESVRVTFDPRKVTYEKLLDVFWRNIDPTDSAGQFVDRGTQYKPAVFYHTPDQKRLAEESIARLQKSGRYSKPIAVEVRKAEEFYPAEDYHQDYYLKNPGHYKSYSRNSGREGYLHKVWGPEIPGK